MLSYAPKKQKHYSQGATNKPLLTSKEELLHSSKYTLMSHLYYLNAKIAHRIKKVNNRSQNNKKTYLNAKTLFKGKTIETIESIILFKTSGNKMHKIYIFKALNPFKGANQRVHPKET